MENTLFSVENGVATLVVNRPKALNALNSATIAELSAHLDALQARKDVAVLVVTGGGEKSFVAGADIKEMKEMSPMQALTFSEQGQAMILKLRALKIPTIAAVHGFALGGGCELAMGCDIIVASEKAKFGQPEVGLGVTPGFGGTQRLARLVGPMVAKKLCLTGEMIRADEAKRIGLVTDIYPVDEFKEAVAKLAAKIASQGPVAASLIKGVIDDGMQVDLDRALQMETQAFALCFATADQKEGMAAFTEKRKAAFKGE